MDANGLVRSMAAGAWPSAGIGPSVAWMLFENSPVGLAFWDTDLRCIWFNEAMVRHRVFLNSTPLGQRVGGVLVGDRPELLEPTLEDVLAGGIPVLDYDWSVGSGESGARRYSMSFFRLQDPQGRPVGVCSLIVDTSGSRIHKNFNLLTGAGTQIGTTLDVMRTAQELADYAVPGLADYVTVDLAETVSDGDVPLEYLAGTSTSIPAFYRAGLASTHSDFPESIWSRGEAVYVPRSSPFTDVLATGRTHFEPKLNTGPGNWLDRDPDRLSTIRATGMHSLMIVPLTARDSLLGVVVYVRTDNPAPFCRTDLELAEGLAERAALSLDNARRYSREHAAALALQRNLLPRRIDGGNAVEIAARYLPSGRRGGVGGDWYDAIPLPDGRVALVVGDVAGHGINAAATMGQLRTAVITLTNLGLTPAEILTHLDQLALDLGRDRHESDPLISATCIYTVYDPATQRCIVASAGHPPPAVVLPDGTAAFAGPVPGAPIGIGMLDYESVEIEVPEGSLIALYTDGLVESRTADIDEGLHRLRTALGRPAGDLEGFASSVLDAMRGTGRPEDDIALLIARTRCSGYSPGEDQRSQRTHRNQPRAHRIATSSDPAGDRPVPRSGPWHLPGSGIGTGGSHVEASRIRQR